MRAPYTFEVGDCLYQGAPMDAKTASHISRRVSPLLVSLIEPAVEQLKIRNQQAAKLAEAVGGEAPPVMSILDLDLGKIIPGLRAAVDMLADMSDDKFEYIQRACLIQVSRQRPGDTGWKTIWNKQANRLQFEDIEGHEMMAIMYHVMKEELGPFFAGLVSTLTDTSPP